LPQPFAVVVGACGHGLSIIRALANDGVPVIALEANPSLPGAHTRFAKVELIPDINGPKLIDSLLELHARLVPSGTPVLFLTNDRMVRTVGEAWPKLQDKYRLSWAHCRAEMLPLQEKSALEQRSIDTGLAYPPTFMLNASDEIAVAVQRIGFPIFVKPARPLARFKTAQPISIEELVKLTQDYQSDLPFLVQKLIPGDDRVIYFSALYLDHGKVLARFDGHKLKSRPLGHTTIAESQICDEVFQLTRQFFDGLKLSGPVSLELKRAPDGQYWVIEPTVGRTDFWIELCIVNGVNLPLIEYCHQINMQAPPQAQQNVAVWFNEERDPFGRFWFLWQKDLQINRRTASYLFLNKSDAKPAWIASCAIVRSLVTSATNRLGKLLGQNTTASAFTVEKYHPSAKLPTDIQLIFEEAQTRDIEFGLSWHRILAQTVYAGDMDVCIFVLRRQGVAIAAFPIRTVLVRHANRIESHSSYYTALYTPVLREDLSAYDLSILILAIRRAYAPCMSFKLSPMDTSSPTYTALMNAFWAAGMVPFRFFCFGNWYLPVNFSWQSYLNQRQSILQHTIKRMSKKFTAAGGTLEVIQDESGLERGLAAYEQVYSSSWKKSEPYPEFISNLVRICAQLGWLRLGVAWLNGKPVASQIWIVANDKASIYKLAYCTESKNFAPGTLLSAKLMEHVIDQDRVNEVDYLIGDDTYKASWMSHRRERWGIVAYNPKNAWGIYGLCKEVLGRIGRGVINIAKTLCAKLT
jgi:predicted ATP-grasp superfamily ATP-dependent carboligase